MLGQLIQQSTGRQRLQIRFEGIGFRLVIDFVSIDIEREGLQIFRFFNWVVDGVLGPLVKRVLIDALFLRRVAVPREGVILTAQHGVMFREDIAEGCLLYTSPSPRDRG